MSDNNEILLNETELPGLTVQAGDDSYENLDSNSLPKINGIKLIGNKTAEQLGLVSSDDLTTTSSRALQTILGTIMDLIYPVGSVLISLREGNPSTWDGKDSNNQPIQGPWSGTTWEQIPGRFLVGVGANGNNAQAADYLNFTNKNDVGGYISTELVSHSHRYITYDPTTATAAEKKAITNSGGDPAAFVYSKSPSINTSSNATTHSHGTPTTSQYKHTHFMTRTEVPEKKRKYGRRRVAAGDSNDYYAATGTAEELASTTNTASASPSHSHTVKLFPIESVGTSHTRSNLPPYLTVYMWKRTS